MGFFWPLLLFEAAIIGVLFGSAGRWDLPWLWAVVGVHAALVCGGMLVIDPDLRKERLRPAPGGRDRLLRWIALPVILAHLVIAGIDVGRFHWSGEVPFGVHLGALACFAAALGLAFWAMAANPFSSPVVRIQRERGHHLVSDGPYRYVRHPGYAGGLAASFCGGVALGSWWSLVPLVAFVALLVRRVRLEDQFLRQELDGYAQYAERVRYRLVPGLW